MWLASQAPAACKRAPSAIPAACQKRWKLGQWRLFIVLHHLRFYQHAASIRETGRRPRWSSKSEILPRFGLISDLGCLTVCWPISCFTMRPVCFLVGTADAEGRQEQCGWTTSGLCCSETAHEVDSAGASSGHRLTPCRVWLTRFSNLCPGKLLVIMVFRARLSLNTCSYTSASPLRNMSCRIIISFNRGFFDRSRSWKIQESTGFAFVFFLF